MRDAICSGMEFRDKLRNLIASRRTSQSQLGRETGLGQPAIAAMLRNERRPYMDQALLIARALGVPLDYLADDTIDEVPRPLTEQETLILELIRRLGIDVVDVLEELFTKHPAFGLKADPNHPALIAARKRLEQRQGNTPGHKNAN